MLTFAWLVLVFSGLGIAFSPQPAFPTIGWTLLTMATVIFLVTMDRWVKALPGILACGVVGGVLTIAAGHTVNHPEVMGSRLDGFAITMLIAISVVLSYRLAKRRLRLLDRVAVFVFALSVFWQVMNSATTVPALTPGTAFLGYAEVFSRLWRRHSDVGKGPQPARNLPSLARSGAW